jgi:sigma-54 specific flagellar transcriptional regulator A
MYGNQIVDVSELPLKYQHIDVQAYNPDYPEELQEQDAINDLFSGFDYQDEEEEEATPLVDLTEVATATNQSVGDNSEGDLLPSEGLNLKDHLADLEVSLIKQSLVKHDYVVARAAETLGMRRTTLVEKMRKYDLQKPSES